ASWQKSIEVIRIKDRRQPPLPEVRLAPQRVGRLPRCGKRRQEKADQDSNHRDADKQLDEREAAPMTYSPLECLLSVELQACSSANGFKLHYIEKGITVQVRHARSPNVPAFPFAAQRYILSCITDRTRTAGEGFNMELSEKHRMALFGWAVALFVA